ncbi:MAG: hypothetical protein U1A78_17575 [Polyangia bacterium]
MRRTSLRRASSGLARLTALFALVGAGAVACNSNSLGGSETVVDMAVPFSGPYSDLPAAPIGAGGVQTAMAGELASAFAQAPAGDSGGPCMTEPTMGALFPMNFTPPLFEWTAVGGQNLFELRLHLSNQTNDLVVYTDQTSFTLPDEMWQGLTQHSADLDIQVTLRGAQVSGGKVISSVLPGTSGTIHIAPVPALGSIVYWWIVPATQATGLKGFRIGDKTVRDVMSPGSITTAGKTTVCLGCHTSSPDGTLAFFTRSDPRWAVDARLVNGSSGAPSAGQISANAMANLSRTTQTFTLLSPAHYSASDAVLLTLSPNGSGGRWEINWTDLHATTGGTGILPRTGDSNGAAAPAWSRDGNTVVYSSSSNIIDGRLDTGNSDLWAVPYNNHNGGAAQPLPGVNSTMTNQYYPTFSPGDTFLSYNRVPRGQQMYDAAPAEIWIAPGKGGTPTRLAANDPPACTGKKSPGLTNSWARWSPSARTANGRHYYWVVFSSKRRAAGNPQLYLGAVVTKDGPAGEELDKDYPAIYIPTQTPNQNNHTPAWDEFQIPLG